MRLLIKQRVFSWTDTYDIYDEEQNPIYFVTSDIFTIGHVIRVLDAQDNEVGCVRQKVMTMLPKFELWFQGESIGMIRRELSFFRPRYVLDCNGWTVDGDIMGWDYRVIDENGSTVMSITKELFAWGDTYVIDVGEEQYQLIGLLIVLAIDAANCQD